jgi:hypothetical protein
MPYGETSLSILGLLGSPCVHPSESSGALSCGDVFFSEFFTAA